MKWKIGAVLMVLVCIAGMIPVIFSADGTGNLKTTVKKSEHEIVLQVGDNRALLDGEEIKLVDEAGNPAVPVRNEKGVVTIPLGILTEALEISAEWDDSGSITTLSHRNNATTLTVQSTNMTVTEGETTRSVALPCAVTAEKQTIYIPAVEVASTLGCYVEVTPALEGDLILLATAEKEPSEKVLNKMRSKGMTFFGPTYEMVMGNSLLVRKHSAHALVNGTIVELEAQVLASGEVNEQAAAGLWLPVSAVSQLTNQTVSYDEEKQRLVSKNGKVDVAVFPVDEVLYCEVNKLAEAAGTTSTLISDYTVAVLTPYAYQNKAFVNDRLAVSAQDLPEVVPPIPEGEYYIALTFDDGPTGGEDGVTMRLLDGLKERNAHATFFLCGYRIQDFNLMMDRYLKEGHELGNHTKDHKDLPSLSRDGIRNQIVKNDDIIESFTGARSTVMRCVGGNYNTAVKEVMAELGLPIIQWNVDTLDWKIRDADNICDTIVNNAKDGDIVLMHDLRECTLEGALRAIDILQKRGFAFVTVSELAQIKGVEMKPGVVYNSFAEK